MTNMGWGDFLLILVACGVAMLICRVLPLFLLKGRELPEGVSKALGFIPPAAVAALGAPGLFVAGVWPAAEPLLAAVAVVMGSVITKSLLWSAVTGVAVYALLSMIVF